MSATTLYWANVIAIVPLSVAGSLLHFAYDWSRHHRIVAIFAAVNESYWEHIKIAFWPVLAWLVALYAAGGWALPGFIPAATIALYTIPVTMIAVVFGYKSVLRRNVLWLDIAAFFLTVGVSLIVVALIATELDAGVWTNVVSVAFLTVLGIAFARYTLHPPAEPDVFVDPINARYGLRAHPDGPDACGAKK